MSTASVVQRIRSNTRGVRSFGLHAERTTKPPNNRLQPSALGAIVERRG